MLSAQFRRLPVPTTNMNMDEGQQLCVLTGQEHGKLVLLWTGFIFPILFTVAAVRAFVSIGT